VPTVGGVLLVGENREQHFPDAWIQTGRFKGVDKSRILDRAEIRAHLVRAVEEAITFVEKHAMRGADIGRVRHRERWSVPPIAVREAVVNAVVHADYAQRGAPTGRVTNEIAKVIGLTPRATRTRLVRLVERGLVREVGTSPQDPKRRYFLST